jgi:hypothetical protein
MITSTQLTSFDENSGYPNTGMPPGKVFEYRIKNGMVLPGVKIWQEIIWDRPIHPLSCL